MIMFLVTAVIVIIVMLLLRYVIHSFFPSWGTVFSNLILGLGLLWPDMMQAVTVMLGEAQGLPWTNILDAKTAQAVIFGILVANMVMRKLGAKAAV